MLPLTVPRILWYKELRQATAYYKDANHLLLLTFKWRKHIIPSMQRCDHEWWNKKTDEEIPWTNISWDTGWILWKQQFKLKCGWPGIPNWMSWIEFNSNGFISLIEHGFSNDRDLMSFIFCYLFRAHHKINSEWIWMSEWMSSHTVTANILLTQQIQMPCGGASWDEIKDSEAFPKKKWILLDPWRRGR